MNTLKNNILRATGIALLSIFSDLASAEAAILIDYRNEEIIGFIRNDLDRSEDETLFWLGTGFSINASAHVTQVLWSGGYEPSNTHTPTTDNFLIQLFTITGADINGLSTTPLADLTGNVSYFVKPVQLYNDTAVYDTYFYTMSLPEPFQLNPGSYLISILNDTSNDLDDTWGWARTAGGGALFRFDETEHWNGLAGGFPFALKGNIKEDVTPVPTPALLPGILGLGLGIWRRRKIES